jgi:V/A-type H+-transporting ATPase subunit D
VPKIELPPTKSSLRKLKEDLSFAYEGYDLLNQKREILAMEIVRRIGVLKTVEADFQRALHDLYSAYRVAAVDIGAETITLQSAIEPRSYYLHLDVVKFMGLKLLHLRIAMKHPRAPATLAQTSARYDEARNISRQTLSLLVQYATMTKSIILLSRELKKVQRRVNALDKIFIPQHEEAQKYISDRLDEMEREEVFVKKLIHDRKTR